MGKVKDIPLAVSHDAAVDGDGLVISPRGDEIDLLGEYALFWAPFNVPSVQLKGKYRGRYDLDVDGARVRIYDYGKDTRIRIDPMHLRLKEDSPTAKRHRDSGHGFWEAVREISRRATVRFAALVGFLALMIGVGTNLSAVTPFFGVVGSKIGYALLTLGTLLLIGGVSVGVFWLLMPRVPRVKIGNPTVVEAQGDTTVWMRKQNKIWHHDFTLDLTSTATALRERLKPHLRKLAFYHSLPIAALIGGLFVASMLCMPAFDPTLDVLPFAPALDGLQADLRNSIILGVILASTVQPGLLFIWGRRKMKRLIMENLVIHLEK